MQKIKIEESEKALLVIDGKQYVIIDSERYKQLKEAEILLSYIECMKDYEEGRYHTNLEQHIKNIS